METNILRVLRTNAMKGKRNKCLSLINGAGECAKTISWGEFNDGVSTVSHFFKQAQKLRVGTRIATLLGNEPETLITSFGIIQAGGSLVPLNSLLTNSQIVGMLNDSQSRFIVRSPSLKHLYPDSSANPNVEAIYESNFATALKTAPSVFDEISLADEYNIIYTSGTTGTPKGIIQTHFARLHFAWSNSICMSYNSNSRGLTTTSLSSNGTMLCALPTLFCGGHLHVMEKFDPHLALKAIEENRITHTFMVPTQVKMCVEAQKERKYDLSSLKCLLSAGSLLSSSVRRAALNELTKNLYELYGCSEGGATMIKPWEFEAKAGSVGRPVIGFDVKISEPDSDGVGEILFSGAGMMSAYNNRAKETEETMFLDEFKQRWLRTGDIGKLDEDGFLSILDRKKDMIKSGGFNVFPKDIEDIMLQPNAFIKDVAVIAVPHSKWGESPFAIVVPTNATVTEKQVLEFTNSKVSKTQRLVGVKLLRVDDLLPRNVLGKLIKKDLRDAFWKMKDEDRYWE